MSTAESYEGGALETLTVGKQRSKKTICSSRGRCRVLHFGPCPGLVLCDVTQAPSPLGPPDGKITY